MHRKWIAAAVAGTMAMATAGSAFAQGDAAPAPMQPGGAAGAGAAFISTDAALIGVAALALAGGLIIGLSGNNSHATSTTSTTK